MKRYLGLIFAIVLSAFFLTHCSAFFKGTLTTGGDKPNSLPNITPVISPSPTSIGLALPSPVPELPTADIFMPPTLNVSDSGPDVASYTWNAAPGDTVIVSGQNFPQSKTRFRIFSHRKGETAAIETDVGVLRASRNVAGFVLPKELPASSMFLIYPEVDGVVGKPFAINHAEAQWVGPNSVQAGEKTAVFGRNLSYNNGKTDTKVLVKAAQSSDPGTWVSTTSVNPYRVEFIVPPELKPGSYEVWVHNLHGGRYGWSEPVLFTVRASNPWKAMSERVYNVKNYGALGNGVADDISAINAAFQAARTNAPSTVYFPSGTYKIGAGLQVPTNVRILGDGKDSTFIQPSSTYSRSFFLGAGVGCETDTAAVSVEKLTLDASGTDNLYDDRAVEFRNCYNLLFLNARINAGNGGLDFHGSTRVYFDHVEFIMSGIFFGAASQVFIDHTDFRMRHDGNGMYVWGGNDYSITNSRAFDYDQNSVDGFGSGRWFVTNGAWGSVHNLYIADNQTIDLAPSIHKVDQNSGEQILFEMGGNYYSGSAVSVSSTVVQLPNYDANSGYANRDLIFVDGKGLGQHRKILSQNNADRTVTLDKPLKVPPDSTSRVDVGSGVFNAVIYQNSLQGKDDYQTRYTASTGIQDWGYAMDIIGDSNRLEHFRTAIPAWSVANDNTPVSPIAFNLYVNNIITNNMAGIFIIPSNSVKDPAQTLSAYGMSVRNNLIDGITDRALGAAGGGNMELNVFERNQARNSFQGVFLSSGATDGQYGDILFFNNQFSRGSAPVNGSIGFSAGTNSTWIGNGNTYDGYQN